jgi:hypothetical protein
MFLQRYPGKVHLKPHSARECQFGRTVSKWFFPPGEIISEIECFIKLPGGFAQNRQREATKFMWDAVD